MKKILLVIILIINIFTLKETFAQGGTWQAISSITGPGAVNGRVFAISFQYIKPTLPYTGKLYFGTGQTDLSPTTTLLSDFWEYNPIGDFWTQKADVPGGGRSAAVGFQVGENCIVGTGIIYNGAVLTVSSNLYRYTPFTNAGQPANTWQQQDNVPGPGRCFAIGFGGRNSIKGWIGGGKTTTGISFTDKADLDDFYQYNDRLFNYFGTYYGSMDFATTLPFGARAGAVSLTYADGNAGIIIGGFDNTGTNLRDVWLYGSNGPCGFGFGTGVWTRLRDIPGPARRFATGFSKNAFFGNGQLVFYGGGATSLSARRTDFWLLNRQQAYNYCSSSTGENWRSITAFPDARFGASGMALYDQGYVGAGYTTISKQDFYTHLPTPRMTLLGSNLATCAGSTFRVRMTSDNSILPGNQFDVYISNDGFNNSTIVGSLVRSNAGNFNIVCQIPETMEGGLYELRVLTSNPQDVSNGIPFTVYGKPSAPSGMYIGSNPICHTQIFTIFSQPNSGNVLQNYTFGRNNPIISIGGITVNQIPGSALVSTDITTSQFQGVQYGIISLTGSSSFGCVSFATYLNLTINGSPLNQNIPAPNTICGLSFDSRQYTFPSVTGENYTWLLYDKQNSTFTGKGTISPILGNITTLTGLESGSLKLTAIASNYCSNLTNTNTTFAGRVIYIRPIQTISSSFTSPLNQYQCLGTTYNTQHDWEYGYVYFWSNTYSGIVGSANAQLLKTPTLTTTSYNFRANTTGTGTIFLRRQDSFGCSSDWVYQNFTVSGLPSITGIITGPSSFCGPNTVNAYYSETLAGINYVWGTSSTPTFPQKAIVTTTNQNFATITGLLRGGAAILLTPYLNSMGSCAGTTLTKNVFIAAPQTATNNLTLGGVCQGKPVVYTIQNNTEETNSWYLVPSSVGGILNVSANKLRGTITGFTNPGTFVLSITTTHLCGTTYSNTVSGQVVNTLPTIPTITGLSGTPFGDPHIECRGDFYPISPFCTGNAYLIQTIPFSQPITAWRGGASINCSNGLLYPRFYNQGLNTITSYAMNACGNSPTAVYNVTVVGIPDIPSTISGPTLLCVGTSNVYSVSTALGVGSYEWYIDGEAIITSTNFNTATIQSTGLGMFTLTVIPVPLNCTTIKGIARIQTFDNRNLDVLILTTTGLCVGYQQQISITTIPGRTYLWQLDNENAFITNSISGITTIIGVNSGTGVTLSVTSYDQCNIPSITISQHIDIFSCCRPAPINSVLGIAGTTIRYYLDPITLCGNIIIAGNVEFSGIPVYATPGTHIDVVPNGVFDANQYDEYAQYEASKIILSNGTGLYANQVAFNSASCTDMWYGLEIQTNSLSFVDIQNSSFENSYAGIYNTRSNPNNTQLYIVTNPNWTINNCFFNNNYLRHVKLSGQYPYTNHFIQNSTLTGSPETMYWPKNKLSEFEKYFTIVAIETNDGGIVTYLESLVEINHNLIDNSIFGVHNFEDVVSNPHIENNTFTNIQTLPIQLNGYLSKIWQNYIILTSTIGTSIQFPFINDYTYYSSKYNKLGIYLLPFSNIPYELNFTNNIRYNTILGFNTISNITTCGIEATNIFKTKFNFNRFINLNSGIDVTITQRYLTNQLGQVIDLNQDPFSVGRNAFINCDKGIYVRGDQLYQAVGIAYGNVGCNTFINYNSLSGINYGIYIDETGGLPDQNIAFNYHSSSSTYYTNAFNKFIGVTSPIWMENTNSWASWSYYAGIDEGFISLGIEGNGGDIFGNSTAKYFQLPYTVQSACGNLYPVVPYRLENDTIIKTPEINSNIEVSPNPFNENFTIKFSNDRMFNYDIRVISNTGKLVYSFSATTEETGIKHTINKNFVKGLYLLQVQTSHGVFYKKLICE
ncbi:MAG: T9SS type A sorting domain-containing protein [Bacteroidota bacterium]|nr:T9SS type A sorting domain-containing protein [Bacteroidota bacterium]